MIRCPFDKWTPTAGSEMGEMHLLDHGRPRGNEPADDGHERRQEKR